MIYKINDVKLPLNGDVLRFFFSPTRNEEENERSIKYIFITVWRFGISQDTDKRQSEHSSLQKN